MCGLFPTTQCTDLKVLSSPLHHSVGTEAQGTDVKMLMLWLLLLL